jgi:hypothetical protein
MENHLHLVVFPEEQVNENSQFRFYALLTVTDRYNEKRKNRLIDCIDARATQALERGKYLICDFKRHKVSDGYSGPLRLSPPQSQPQISSDRDYAE